MTKKKHRQESGKGHAVVLREGDRVRFTPAKGTQRYGTVTYSAPRAKSASVILDEDPFPVMLEKSQLSACDANGNDVMSNRKVRKARTNTTRRTREEMATTKEKVSAKELRKRAQALGVAGYESMGRVELAKAVKAASKNGKAEASTESEAPATTTRPRKARTSTAKATTKPASKPKASTTKPATKATRAAKAEATDSDSGNGIKLPKGNAPKSLPADGANPFRKSSNLHMVFNLLVKGGKRRTLAEKLAAKVKLHPYQKDEGEVDLADYDKRILLGAQTLREQYGMGEQRVGRGLEGTIKVFVPGSDQDPRNASGTKTRRVASSKKAAKARG